MADLELVGLHPDGDHLILTDPDGVRHRVVIDEALRVAVRRDRSHLEKIRSDVTLRPREIQALLRAGGSPDAIAHEAGLPVERVRRYEGPVVAERDYLAQQARALRIGRSPDSPTLGDLVVDRLAARGVAAGTVRWDARRYRSEPWQVVVHFHAGDKDQEATWEVDLASGTITALDDEGRWLSETDLSTGAARHLNAVPGAGLYDVEADGDIAPVLHAVDAVIRDSRPRPAPELDSAPEPDSAFEPDSADDADSEGDATEAMLDELSGSRGVRQQVRIEDDDEQAHLELGLWDDPPAAHPPASRPQEAVDATVLPGPGARSEDESRPAAERPKRRGRRTSVPSWDEIVFGAKDD